MFNRTPRRRRHRITIHQVIWAYLVVVLATLLLVVVTYGYTARPGWVGIAGLTLWDWFNLVGVFVPTLIVLLMTTVRGQAKWVGLVFMLVLAAVLLGVIYYGYITRAGWVGVAHQTLRDWFELLYPALAIALVAWLFAQLVARGQDEGQVSPMVIAVVAVGIVGGLVLISYSLGSAFRKGSLDIPPLFSRQAQAPSQLFCLTTFCNSCGTGHKENARKRWNAAGHRRQH
jgi:hypothetical protein